MKKIRNWIKNLLLLVPTVILIFMVWKGCEDKKTLSDYEAAELAMNDTIQKWKDENSRNVAKISVINTLNKKQFLAIESNNKEIKELQALVEDYKKQLREGGSATIIRTETIFDTVIDWRDKFIHDTLNICNFSDTISNDWIWNSLALTNGILEYDLKVIDKYSIVIGEEKQGWFKKRKPFVEVTSENPYSEVKTLRTYQVPGSEPKRFGVGPQVGVGINQFLQPSIYLGLGISWNPIRF